MKDALRHGSNAGSHSSGIEPDAGKAFWLQGLNDDIISIYLLLEATKRRPRSTRARERVRRRHISFVIKHDEGQIPTLDIVVKNPRIGLLAPGRKVWAWFGWLNENVAPIRLSAAVFRCARGVPTSLFQEKVTLKFIARSPDFIQNKQALAETMRRRHIRSDLARNRQAR